MSFVEGEPWDQRCARPRLAMGQRTYRRTGRYVGPKSIIGGIGNELRGTAFFPRPRNVRPAPE
ncbi:hypothetical protein FTUN_4594 [Frigoriglobus tundricola]|uniref:Uncharacterized protein n=1 Tax=Frigoriglobus tundricola TaxID=2774151 RepID=A0A6M5YUU1_9BACT|nr:hypothetical protein FTUN_4594 [Frigoriglobus tundricola]